jgi:hypothetical protein
VFYNQASRPPAASGPVVPDEIVSGAFALIDVVGAGLALAVLSWTKDAFVRSLSLREALIGMVPAAPKDDAGYPQGLLRLSLIACTVTQLIFAAVWLWLLVRGG